jgi:Txe/YoeB family toxin of Txe-Axe toxin-antitoxin module
MEELISEGASGPNRFIIPISPTETAQEAVQMFLETRQHIADLKTRIIRNHTREALITSDDPAVQLNRLYVQRFGPFVGSGGLINSGFTIFMPLSPVLALCVYDPFVYTCPNHSGHFINVRDTADISALNRLQYLKAASNIYFSDWSQRERIRGEFSDASSRRPSSWHRLNYAVEEPSNSGSSTTRTFRAVHTRAARISAQRALLHTETTMLNPGAWFSPLQIRSSPRFVNTRSGLGYLRPSRINANIA